MNLARGLTFHQLIQSADLLAAIYGVDRPHPLRQVQVIRQRARQFHQQCIVGAEPVTWNGIQQTFEVPVSIAVEAHLFGLFLRGEGLKGAGPVVATVGTVGRTRDQAAAPWAGPRTPTTSAGGGVISLGTGRASPTNLITLVKVLQFKGLTQRHDQYWSGSFEKNNSHYLKYIIHFS